MTETHPASSPADGDPFAPSPADTSTLKQWGIQSPDGDFHWDRISIDGFSFEIRSNGLHSLEQRLGQFAEKLHLNPVEFRRQYRLVSRDVVVQYAPSKFCRTLD
ncbi:hypothetical protein GS502_11030 [Rhodococcus hoagii]|nr:hypothetical protein [Prescottella equi]